MQKTSKCKSIRYEKRAGNHIITRIEQYDERTDKLATVVYQIDPTANKLYQEETMKIMSVINEFEKECD